MKNKITLLFLVLAISACKTASGPVGQRSTERHREFTESSFADVAQPTAQMDTLYLIEGDGMSNLTIKIWNDTTFKDTIKVKPKIVMVTKEEMIFIKTRCNKKK